MDEWELRGLIRIQAALIHDKSIDRLLEKLDYDDMALIGDSLISALDGACDELFYRLFEALIPNRIADDETGKWATIREMLSTSWDGV